MISMWIRVFLCTLVCCGTAFSAPIDYTREVYCTEAEAFHCHPLAYCFTFKSADNTVRAEPTCQCPEGFLGNGWQRDDGTFASIAPGFSDGPYSSCQSQGYTTRVVLKFPSTIEGVTFCRNNEKVCQFTDAVKMTIAGDFFGMPVSGYWAMGAMHHQVTITVGAIYLTLNGLWPDAGQARVSATVFKDAFRSAGGIAFPFNIVEYAENGEPRVYRWKTETTNAPIAVQATGMQINSVHFQPGCAKTGCWVVDITYTTGASTGNFNTFYLPKAEGSDTLSVDPTYSAAVLSTFQPKNFPCGSNIVNSDYTTCCLPDLVSNYRPVESFVDWTQTFSTCSGNQGAVIQRPGFEINYEYTVDFPYDMLNGHFQDMPDSPGVFFGGVVDAYIDQYKATVYLDEKELRTKAGQLKGTVGVEHTVDTFIGIANFRPTGLASIDPAAHQVNIHLEKTSFFSVSTAGENAYTFLTYINLRLIAVLRENTAFVELPEAFGTRTRRTNSTGAAHYVQVTFTMAPQYRPNLPTGLVPLDSVRVGKGTFFTDEGTQATLRHKCVDYMQGELEFPDVTVRRSGTAEPGNEVERVEEDSQSSTARHLLHHSYVDGSSSSAMGDQVVGSLDTCHEQSHCFTYTWQKVFDSGCQSGAGCSWKVCQIHNPLADAFCRNQAGKPFDHWCKFPGANCTKDITGKGDPGWFADLPGQAGSSGEVNCQIGRPGQYLFFIVSDGSKCGHFDDAPYVLSGVQRTFIQADNRGTAFPPGSEAYCQPRSSVVKGCEKCGFNSTYPLVGIGEGSRRALVDEADWEEEVEGLWEEEVEGLWEEEEVEELQSEPAEEEESALRSKVSGQLSFEDGAAHTRAGPMDTCLNQKNCILWEITEVRPTGLCIGVSCEFKACMKIDQRAGCVKSGTISHSCVKPSNVCNAPTGFSQATETLGIGNGFTQCQTGKAGTTLQFLLKDGASCGTENDFYPRTSVAGVFPSGDISCQPRPSTISSCTGNNVKQECIWQLTLPNCRNIPTTTTPRPTTTTARPTTTSRAPTTTPRPTTTTPPPTTAPAPAPAAPSPATEVLFNGIDTCTVPGQAKARPESECVWSIKIPDTCTPDATCTDGIRNQGETGVDCGGPCGACDCGSFGDYCGTALSATLATSGCVPCTCEQHWYQAPGQRVCGPWNSCYLCPCDAANNECGAAGSLCQDECRCKYHHPSPNMCGAFGYGGDACVPCDCAVDVGTCGTWGACKSPGTCTCAESGGVHGKCGDYNPLAPNLGCHECTCQHDSKPGQECGDWGPGAKPENCWTCNCKSYAKSVPGMGQRTCGTFNPVEVFFGCRECTCEDNGGDCSCGVDSPDATKTCGPYNEAAPDKGCQACSCAAHNPTEHCGAWPNCETCSCEVYGVGANKCGAWGACRPCSCDLGDGPNGFDGACGAYPVCETCSCQEYGPADMNCGIYNVTEPFKNCHPCTCSTGDGGPYLLCGDYYDGGCTVCPPPRCEVIGLCGETDACHECTCMLDANGLCGDWNLLAENHGCHPCSCKNDAVPAGEWCGDFGADGSTCEACGCNTHSYPSNEVLVPESPAMCGDWTSCEPCTCEKNGDNTNKCGTWGACRPCTCVEDVSGRECGAFGADGSSCQECACAAHDTVTHAALVAGPGVPASAQCGEWGSCHRCTCMGDDGGKCGEWGSCEPCSCGVDSPDATKTCGPYNEAAPDKGCQACSCAAHNPTEHCGAWPNCETCSCEVYGVGANKCGAWGACRPCTCTADGGSAQCGAYPACHLCTCKDDGPAGKKCGSYAKCEACNCGVHDTTTHIAAATMPAAACGTWGSCRQCNCAADGPGVEVCGGPYPLCRTCTCTEAPSGKGCGGAQSIATSQRTCSVAVSSPSGFGLAPPPSASPASRDCCLPFDCAMLQRCSPGAPMCVSPADVPDNFVSFNIPLGIDWLPAPSEQLDANVFVEMVINAVDAKQAAVAGNNPNGGDAPEQMKTTLFASIPVVKGGINIFCDGITAKTDLKDVANADIIVGSAASPEELTRLRILVDVASSNLEVVNPSRIDSDSIEAGLMTLVLKGQASYFASNAGTGRFSLVLEDLLTIHVMEPASCTACAFDAVKRLLAALPSDHYNADSELIENGYALNGAFEFQVDRSSMRAHLQPTTALLARCPFNPPRPSRSNAFPTTCVTRRDVQNAGFPYRPGAMSTAMELEPLQANGKCSSDLADEVKFLQIILGASSYTANLAKQYSCVIAQKYKIDGRYMRAFWINPGYEWTPTQTGGQSIFTISQKLFLFALIRLDEGWGSTEPFSRPPTPSGMPTLSRRRQLLQSGGDMKGTGAGSAGALHEFDVSITKMMANAFGVSADHVAAFKVSMRLTDEEACTPAENDRAVATRGRLAALVEPFASKLETVQILSMEVDRADVDCPANRRTAFRRQLMASGATAAVEMLLVFSEGGPAEFSMQSFAQQEGIMSVDALEVSPAVDTTVPFVGFIDTGTTKDVGSSSGSSNIGLIAGCSAGAGLLLVAVGCVVHLRSHRKSSGSEPVTLAGVYGSQVFRISEHDLLEAKGGTSSCGSASHIDVHQLADASGVPAPTVTRALSASDVLQANLDRHNRV